MIDQLLIDQLLTGIGQLLTPVNVVVAITSAIGIGFMAAWVARLPLYHASQRNWYWQHTFRMLTVLSIVFFFGQLVTAVQEADPLWGRIVGRYLLFELFSIFVGVGLYLGLRFRTRSG